MSVFGASSSHVGFPEVLGRSVIVRVRCLLSVVAISLSSPRAD